MSKKQRRPISSPPKGQAPDRRQASRTPVPIPGPYFGTVHIESADGQKDEIHVSAYNDDDARKLLERDKLEYVERTYGAGVTIKSIQMTKDPSNLGRMIILPGQK